MLKTIETLYDSINIKEGPLRFPEASEVIGELTISSMVYVSPEGSIDPEKVVKYRIIGHLYREVEERLLEIGEKHVHGMRQELWEDIGKLISDLRVE